MELLITAILVFVVVSIIGMMAAEHRWLRVVLGCVLVVFAGFALYSGFYVAKHASADANASGLGALFVIAEAVGVISAIASIIMFAWALRSGD